MTHLKKTVIILLITGLSTFSALTQVVYAPSVPSVRLSALGGAHAAYTDGMEVLFTNPAGFRSTDQTFSFAQLELGLRGPVFDIAGAVTQGLQGGDFTAILTSPSFVDNVLSRLHAGVSLTGPVYFGFTGRGLGFGIFTIGDFQIENSSAAAYTLSLKEDLLLTGGYAFRIPLPQKSRSTLDVGMQLKGSLGGEIVLEESLLQIMGLLSSLDLGIITGAPFKISSTIGFDAGILYDWNNTIQFGIVGRDTYTPSLLTTYTSLSSFLDGSASPVVSKGQAPFGLDAGIGITPPLGRVERYLSDLSVYVDYSNILDFWLSPATSTNPLLHIGAGMEVKLLQVLSIRAGFKDTLFAAGLGLDMSVLKVNLAMYGTELTTEPGLFPVYNVSASFEFRY